MFIVLGMYNFGLYNKVNFINLLPSIPPLKLWNQRRKKNKGHIWHCDLALNVKLNRHQTSKIGRFIKKSAMTFVNNFTFFRFRVNWLYDLDLHSKYSRIFSFNECIREHISVFPIKNLIFILFELYLSLLLLN